MEPETIGPFPELEATLLQFSQDAGCGVQFLIANARRDRPQFWKTQLLGRHLPSLRGVPSFSLQCITSEFCSIARPSLGADSHCPLATKRPTGGAATSPAMKVQ